MSVLNPTLLGLLATGIPVSSFVDPLIRRPPSTLLTVDRGRATEHVPSRALVRLWSESRSIPPEAERDMMNELPDDPDDIQVRSVE